MNDEVVPVTAEWALWGKQPVGREDELLGHSDGAITRAAFSGLIQRYFVGPRGDLPQVTVGGFGQDSDASYVGIGIHSRAKPERYDAVGREVILTSIYCLPFSQLAAGPVSYQTMYERFREFRLPIADRSPIQTELAEAQPGAPANELAVRVAALLLTGRAVCISGTEDVPLERTAAVSR